MAELNIEELSRKVALNAFEKLMNTDYHGRPFKEWIQLAQQAEAREYCENCGGCVMSKPDPFHCEIYEAAHGGFLDAEI